MPERAGGAASCVCVPSETGRDRRYDGTYTLLSLEAGVGCRRVSRHSSGGGLRRRACFTISDPRPASERSRSRPPPKREGGPELHASTVSSDGCREPTTAEPIPCPEADSNTFPP